MATWWLLVRKSDLSDADADVEVRYPGQLLRNHPNWDPILDNFALVPATSVDQGFYAASYRHRDTAVAACDLGQSTYLTGNYRWFLEMLPEGAYGWLDVLCIGPAGHSLPQAFGYMGALYAEGTVLAEYLQDPLLLLAGTQRGWIFQESAFTRLDKTPLLSEEASHKWETLIGVLALCKLCERRGVFEHAERTGQVFANALCNDWSRPSMLPDGLQDSEKQLLDQAHDTLASIQRAAQHQGFEPHQWQRVWVSVCNVAELFSEYRCLFPEGARRLEAIRNPAWSSLATSLVGAVMSDQTNLSKVQAPALLRAYASCQLERESDRDVAIFGLAARLLRGPSLQHAASTSNGAIVFPWCWREISSGSEFMCPIRSSDPHKTATLGLGRLYLTKHDDTFFDGTGLVRTGGDSDPFFLIISIVINTDENSGNPIYVQVIVNDTNVNEGAYEALSEAQDTRTTPFG